jgi:hypothetical protein
VYSNSNTLTLTHKIVIHGTNTRARSGKSVDEKNVLSCDRAKRTSHIYIECRFLYEIFSMLLEYVQIVSGITISTNDNENIYLKIISLITTSWYGCMKIFKTTMIYLADDNGRLS